MLKKSIKCPVCKRVFEEKDKVSVDVLNTIIHFDCVYNNDFQIKTTGHFWYICQMFNITRNDVEKFS